MPRGDSKYRSSIPGTLWSTLLTLHAEIKLMLVFSARQSPTQEKRSSPSGAELQRHQEMYQLLYADTDGGHELESSTIREWNLLPEEAVIAESVECFRQILRDI
ncbi:hypothetical protein F7725_020661 [Dissostichus mawsoni]|uniref:Uncharacterized protein n=1 Tax=Dissostichus mawsoni TaxID=36200 RepID=A0A7J5YET0_DISMA|nr:hypothetical protein F7725_020661 [Dissostichus mawsoni]